MLDKIAEEAVTLGITPLPIWPTAVWLDHRDMIIEATEYADSEAIGLKTTFPTKLRTIEQPEQSPCRLTLGTSDNGARQLVIEFFADMVVGYQPGLLSFVHREFKILAIDLGIQLPAISTHHRNEAYDIARARHLTTLLAAHVVDSPLSFKIEPHHDWVRLTCRNYDDRMYERARVKVAKQKCAQLNQRTAPGRVFVEWDVAVTAYWDFYYTNATDTQLRTSLERGTSCISQLVEQASRFG
ncbi:hypothetical protein CMUST_06875 [Corynebacterium mustelae]|uniref:Uncharacterized protein n=1 Tax=Corynebacterium mustelae TaxID=571915 RepID=A0A0G3GX41_9CORY|nr:hypothetical protein [Corynebacterium mustelae]AKK05709.1 hypothetical protein CMUST_06875 [Corynebacterium mustelae]